MAVPQDFSISGIAEFYTTPPLALSPIPKRGLSFNVLHWHSHRKLWNISYVITECQRDEKTMATSQSFPLPLKRKIAWGPPLWLLILTFSRALMTGCSWVSCPLLQPLWRKDQDISEGGGGNSSKIAHQFFGSAGIIGTDVWLSRLVDCFEGTKFMGRGASWYIC